MDKKAQDFQERLLATFRIEAEEHIQVLSAGLFELERETSSEKQAQIIDSIFREAHSLKGAARAVDMTAIESICQALESLFADFKSNAAEISPALFDVLHDSIDSLSKCLSSPAAGPSGQSIANILRRLESALTTGTPAKAPDFLSMPSQHFAKTGEHESPRPGPAVEEKAVPMDTVRIATTKLDALLYQAEGLLSAKLTATQRGTEIRELMNSFTTLKKERDKIASAMRAVRRSLTGNKNGNGLASVDSEQNRLLEFISWESAFLKSLEFKVAVLAKFAERDWRSLGTMVDGLLEDMKKALMLPIACGIDIFPKLLRDLSKAQGKEVDLVIQGSEIEIDRRILDDMRDPLIHLARNSIDHGIETPEVRRRKGKSPRGTITIAVTQKDGHWIEILMSDDGAGIDTTKLGEAAQKLGLISPDELKSAEAQKLLPLVFQSGVSTSPIITDISGRGLGLAIAREKVERLGGVISVDMRFNEGTRFRIVLPLTLATYRGVHVRIHDHRFVLPTTYVQQVLRLKRDQIKTIENRETIQWNGKAVALIHLADVLGLSHDPMDDSLSDYVQAVVLGPDGKHIAFLVDEIIDEREVVVKPLGKQLSRVRNFAGATVLGTGKAVPILDVPDLLRSAVNLNAPAKIVAAKPEVREEKKSVLVAEDSITSRTLIKNILETAGYSVSTAVDGMDAFSMLKSDRFDLMVSDVEMPRMNGLDLTDKIRTDKALHELPVVLVTSLESREHRERGIDAGANAYIVKSSFDQSNLLDVVRRLI